MKMTVRILTIACTVTIAAAAFAAAGESKGVPVFIASPMVGFIENEVTYNAGRNTGDRQLKERGAMQAINMLYSNPDITVGSMIHSSKTDSSDENGYLIYANKYFNIRNTFQPMAGIYVDYVNIYSQLSGQDSFPFTSFDVNTSVMSLHYMAGVSYKRENVRVTPFAGYFNEQVETAVSSPGMSMGGQVRNGIKSNSSIVLDYATLGTKFEWTVYRFIRIDTKFYYRFRDNESALFTTRNRIDFYLSKRAGISIKYDLFQDKIENNYFAFAGPTFVF